MGGPALLLLAVISNNLLGENCQASCTTKDKKRVCVNGSTTGELIGTMKASRLVLAFCFVLLLQVGAGRAFLIRRTPLLVAIPRYGLTTKSAKKPVEQVDLESGEIINTFDSIKEAAEAVGSATMSTRKSIGQVVNGRIRSAAGFFWRRKGDHKKFPRPRKWYTPCEQIDMETLQVVAVYPSVKAAAKAMNCDSQFISRILNKPKQRSSYRGFYWRKVGDTSAPRPAKQQKVKQLKQPVQQICPDTGVVIATFDSCTEAEVALDIRSYMISKVLRGVQHTTGGFHFRAVGKPRKFKRDYTPRSVHQISPDTGEIIETFPSLKRAAYAVGVTSASISSAAHGKTKTSAGYRWELAKEKSVVNQDEKSVNTG